MLARSRFWKARSAGIGFLVLILLAGLLAPEPTIAQDTIDTDQQIRLAAEYATTAVIEVGQTQAETEFPIDSASEVAISVFGNSTTLEVLLVDPSGGEHLAGATDAIVTESTAVDSIAEDVEARAFEFLLSNPPAGLWKLRVSESGAVASVRVASILLRSSSELVLGLLGVATDHTRPRPAMFAAVVADAQGPILPSEVSSVQGVALHEDGAETELTLLDDGNGADFTPSDGAYTVSADLAAGQYDIAIEARGTRNGRAFARTAAGQFRVVESCGTLNGPAQTELTDANTDGIPEAIAVTVAVDAVRDAQFHVLVMLQASSGAILTQSAMPTLTVGPHDVALSFPAEQLASLQADGPYEIREVRLSCQGAEGFELSDFRVLDGNTPTVVLDDLTPAGAKLAGIVTEEARDTNGNGLFDLLEFTVPLQSGASGNVQWSAALVAPDGRTLDETSGQDTAAGELVTLTITFDGAKIGAAAADGPYALVGLTVFGPAEPAVIQRVGETGSYQYDQFEGASTGPAAPSIYSGGVVNNASFAPSPAPVAPGTIAAVFGSNLNDGSSVLFSSFGPDGKLVTSLGGASATVDGTLVPMFYSTPGQIGIQIPFEVAGQASAQIVVTVGGQSSVPRTINLEATAPGVFTANQQGTGIAAVLHQDGVTPVTVQNPAQPNEVVVFFATGLGALTPPLATGAPSVGNQTAATPTITIDGEQAVLEFSGAAPGFVGLNQVNVRIPAGTRTASDIPVVLTIEGKQSNSVTIAVSQ